LCYTLNVTANQHIWRIWAQKLHRWGISEITASLLEVLGPLTILGAQLVHLGSPILHRTVADNQISALADLLEEPVQTRAFITYLRESDLS